MKRSVIRLRAAFCAMAFALTANATQLVSNGGFESGTFSSWTVTTSGGPGSWFVTGSPFTPLSGFPTVGPASGSFYAVSDQFGPGTFALTQSFTVPLGTVSATLSFDMFVNDLLGLGGSPQMGQVDLLAAGASPILGVPLSVFYSADTVVSGGVPNPYLHLSMSIMASLTPGTTYQLRFLTGSSSGPINVGVDNASLITTSAIPEPGTFFPTALVVGIFAYRRLRNGRSTNRGFVGPKIQA